MLIVVGNFGNGGSRTEFCVISTLGGILFLHEKKTQKGLIYTVIGLILIVAGAVLTVKLVGLHLKF